MEPTKRVDGLPDDKEMILGDAKEAGGVLRLNLHYPPYNPPEQGRIHALQIGLMAVRAADDIRVSYDYRRDGWKIEQEEIVSDDGCYHGTGDWQEVAFVQAWGREREVGKQKAPTP